jgi:hypothetical protein
VERPKLYSVLPCKLVKLLEIVLERIVFFRRKRKIRYAAVTKRGKICLVRIFNGIAAGGNAHSVSESLFRIGEYAEICAVGTIVNYSLRAYITDIGMCGPNFSVLGIKPECIIEKMTTGLPVKFIPSINAVTAHGIEVEIDKKTKKAISIRRITF